MIEINLLIEEDNSITVVIMAGEFLSGIQETMGPAVEVIITPLMPEENLAEADIRFSGGLHGVGASVVNALSEELEVFVHLKGKSITKNMSGAIRALI